MENLPKIAIIGYGSMGREVEKQAKNDGFEVTDIFEINDVISSSDDYDFDVAIDFTYPNAVIENVRAISKIKKNIVIGTTGWQNDLPAVEQIVKESGIGAVWGNNFSIGVQMYYRIIELASQLVKNMDNIDIMINEMHHAKKKDSPSGTALNIADIILSNVKFKNDILTCPPKNYIEPNKLHITSTRGGDITALHTVYIDSTVDTIELIHRAKNRTGFANGALLAAKWIYQKKGFYQFNKLLKEIWGI